MQDDIELGTDAESLRRDFVHKLYCEQAKFPAVATLNDFYLCLAHVVRDRLLQRWTRTVRSHHDDRSRTVVYLSAEYLMGPQLGNHLLAMGLEAEARKAMEELGLDLDAIIEQEEEPGLGNGGLGRLAACFLDSLATLNMPAIGYGIRYEYGIFEQRIRDGWQVEHADKWLRFGNPWEVRRYEIGYPVGFGGSTSRESNPDGGEPRVTWTPERLVKGVACDNAVPGFATENANLLRLWTATVEESFDFQAFNIGDYYGAVLDRVRSENITKVLYPNDASAAGKQLRLEQQYFFVSCSLQDMIRIYKQRGKPLTLLHERFVVQLNDTHPSIAIAELMRLLMDTEGLGWDEAWETTSKSFGYTNHTLLPEALETWSLELFSRVLPRHLEIIFEINKRFLSEVAEKYPGDMDRLRRMSIIDETHGRRVRMAFLATVGSATVNGVAELHSRLLGETVMRDFAEMWPEKFHNVTNGVTPRRFVALANPRLTTLISDAIGDGWIRDLDQIAGIEKLAEDAAFQGVWREVKAANKRSLSTWLAQAHQLPFDPSRLLDVQVKRIHEYKRQHLMALHILATFDRIRRDGPDGVVPRTYFFAGKAAPGYRMAKLIIRFIHAVGEAIARDPVARSVIEVVFLPDFSVKSGQRVYPSADLSEQISTAGMEASGTGNMKLAMNGALTIGTLDGANVEIREAVGADHFFLFGMTAAEVAARKAAGYRPEQVLREDSELDRLLGLIQQIGTGGEFDELVSSLRHRDEFLVLADYRAYAEAQSRVSEAWLDTAAWTKSSILNVARMGRFSSDRAIAEYCENLWGVKAAPAKKRI